MEKFFSASSADFISYRAPKSAHYGTVVVENVSESSRPDLRNSRPQDRQGASFEDKESALEISKKNFLQAWNDYIEFLKHETEENERKTLKAKHDEKVAEHNRKARASLESDISTLPVHGNQEYKNLISLIENTKAHTTNPKYSEWEPGISKALPHLEEAAEKLKPLQFPTAERDIIEAANHKERKIKQSLELVKRLDSGLQDAHANFHQRIESFGEVKKNISATLNPEDPLNIDDYEPPHEQAIANLRAIARGVLKSQKAWEADLRNLERAFEEDNPLGDLRKQEEESAAEVRRTGADLDAAQEEVKRCWDALMEAQRKCTRAEKSFITAKVQDEVNKKLVEEVAGQVERQKEMLERSVGSCEQYCEALKCVEDYINARWDPWRAHADGETRRLVTAVSELYAFAEQALGDLIDRKQSQVDHAAKEEKDCTEKYLSKWEQLDRNADAEMDRALEHRRVKEAARAEAQHYQQVRAGIRRLTELCRPAMTIYGISVAGAEQQSAVEEWDKTRIRLYNELEGLSQPVIKKTCVIAQTADHPETSSVSRPMLPVDEDLRLINALLLSAPSVLAAPPGCAGAAGVVERQRKTAGDMLIRAEYVAEEVRRQGGSLGAGESADRALEQGVAALRAFIDRLKSTPARAAPAASSSVTAAAKPAPQAATSSPSRPAATAPAATATTPASEKGTRNGDSDRAASSGGVSGAGGTKSRAMDAFLSSLQGEDGSS